MKILIVDDQPSNRMILKFFLESEGHSICEAEDGLVAIKKFTEFEPDCVLLDIVMPNMDGFAAAQEIKKHSEGYHVPIIFLTAKTDEASILKCLESGGDDYLPKPVNQVMLMAKIRAHARTQELTEQIRAKNEELTFLHATLQQEHEMGQFVLNHSLMRSWQDCPIVRSDLSSMSTFNGDIFLVAQKPNGGIYAMLGDFTGHGLGAAIGTIPLSQVFFAMCSKGKSVSEIARAMNAALSTFLPDYMFCAATLLDLNEAGDTFTVWAGGLPNGFVLRPGEGLLSRVESANMPMGILDEAEFNSEVEIIQVKEGDKLLLLTDGILEGTGANEEMFGEERLIDTIATAQNGYFDRLLQTYEAFTGEEDQKDDCSIVEITAGRIAKPYADQDQDAIWLPWQAAIKLDPDQLRRIDDPIVQVMQLFPRTMLFSRHTDMVRTVLAELFSNALEHGLLGLHSDLKSTADGFLEYYSMRSERLATLEDGYVNISLDYDPERSDKELRILVEDSGEGYSVQLCSLEENQNEWGRGLALVNSLCHTVNFNRRGATVEAFFTLR